jgi:hypothetical protein
MEKKGQAGKDPRNLASRRIWSDTGKAFNIRSALRIKGYLTEANSGILRIFKNSKIK